ncbi:MAG: O-methyltransferase [Clostridiaceae bacterium]|jgi:predicted O-methyltransferase YrrM|nr:O-methyltransferase [Clostridiaceae bacterium]
MEDRIIYPEIIEYLRSTICRETGFLKELEEYASLHHIPIIQPESATLLKILVKLHKPQRILEAGTAIGYSACILYEAMNKAGIIDTIEIDEEMADLAMKNINSMGFDKCIRVLVGDALEVMECLNSPYDMIFLDAAKGQYNEYLTQALRLLKSGGLLISDNVLYKGLVAQIERVPHKHRTIAVNLREYLQQICSDDRLETTLIPIGDGMAISLKKGD